MIVRSHRLIERDRSVGVSTPASRMAGARRSHGFVKGRCRYDRGPTVQLYDGAPVQVQCLADPERTAVAGGDVRTVALARVRRNIGPEAGVARQARQDSVVQVDELGRRVQHGDRDVGGGAEMLDARAAHDEWSRPPQDLEHLLDDLLGTDVGRERLHHCDVQRPVDSLGSETDVRAVGLQDHRQMDHDVTLGRDGWFDQAAEQKRIGCSRLSGR